MAVAENTVLRIVASLLLPDEVIAQNIFYSIISGASPPYDDDDVVSDLKDWIEDIYTSWSSIGDADVGLNQIQVYKYDPVGLDWDEVGSDTSAIVGLVVGDMLPHGVAAFTQARTTDPDVNAAKYWPGITETSQTEGSWVGATVTQLLAMCAIWVATDTGALTGATLQPGVWSVVKTAFENFLINYVVNVRPAYQRRRKPGVGS